MLDFLPVDFMSDEFPTFNCPLTEYCQDNQSITAAVIIEINQRLCPEFNTLDKFSQVLGVSPKKLQRLLKDEGTSFSAILDTFRQVQAILMLRTKKLPLKEIAVKLGYSSGASFNHACKRWFETSPKKLRLNSLATRS